MYSNRGPKCYKRHSVPISFRHRINFSIKLRQKYIECARSIKWWRESPMNRFNWSPIFPAGPTPRRADWLTWCCYNSSNDWRLSTLSRCHRQLLEKRDVPTNTAKERYKHREIKIQTQRKNIYIDSEINIQTQREKDKNISRYKNRKNRYKHS
jgi:hypothetical protein